MGPLILFGIAPLSWKVGVMRRKPGKLVLALGPLRLSLHDLSLPNWVPARWYQTPGGIPVLDACPAPERA